MNDAEAEALGRRLIACTHFRPMRGMRDMQGRTWTPDLLWRWTPGVDVPDLRDPATRGCVLELVRKAWNSPATHVLLVTGLYRWECADRQYVHGYGPTEAEALVVSLEEAE